MIPAWRLPGGSCGPWLAPNLGAWDPLWAWAPFQGRRLEGRGTRPSKGLSVPRVGARPPGVHGPR